MATFKTYNRTTDITSQLLNIGSLSLALLNDATVGPVFDGINKQQGSDSFDVYYSVERTTVIDTAADAIVLAHDGQPVPAEIQPVEMASPVPITKPIGDSESVVSHDFTDKTSWYHDSVRETGVTLTGTGTGPYQHGSNTHWIDLQSGLIPKEDSFSGPYLAKIYDNGVEVTSGFTINYAAGAVTFDSAPTGPVTADYSRATTSTWKLTPEAGQKIVIEHAELDFSVDVQMATVHFDMWVANPLFDPQSPTDPDDETFVPGVSSGNPFRFLYSRVTYKNYKDIQKIANEVQVCPALHGQTADVLRAVFDYGKAIPLRDSIKGELRIRIDNDTPFVKTSADSYGSITLYIQPEVESA